MQKICKKGKSQGQLAKDILVDSTFRKAINRMSAIIGDPSEDDGLSNSRGYKRLVSSEYIDSGPSCVVLKKRQQNNDDGMPESSSYESEPHSSPVVSSVENGHEPSDLTVYSPLDSIVVASGAASFDTQPHSNLLNSVSPTSKSEDQKSRASPTKASGNVKTQYNTNNGRKTSLNLTLQNLPSCCTEKEIFSFLSPFVADSSACRCTINSSASTATITMPDQESFDKASSYINNHSPQIRSNPISILDIPVKVARFPKSSSRDAPHESRVLFTTVTNVGRYPVDLDVLYRVFSRYGTVEKIILFPKPTGRCQSLIQLSSIAEARNALVNLNHRDIYDGCNTLQIDYSRLSDLIVNSNTTRSWDYLVAPRYTDVSGAHQPPYNVVASAPVSCGPNTPFPPMPWPPSNGTLDPGVLQQQHHLLRMRDQSGLFQEPLQHMMTSHTMYHGMTGIPADPFFRRLTPDIIEKLPPELQNLKILRQINPKQTSVVICYNLPVGDITVVKLFNLFSIYGIVEKIKLLRGKESTALIQFSDPFFAALACYFLEGAPFFGVEGGLQIEMSRNFEVKIAPITNNINSSEASDEAKRSGEFFLKDQRCTREEGTKIVRGACRPTSTVFISNIPNTVQEAALRDILSTAGVVQKIKLNVSGAGKKSTAVAELSSEKEAVAAICNLHNYRIAQCHLKFAFTKQILTN